MELFKLFGSIFVDNEKANKSIHKTEEKAEGLGKKMLKGTGTALKWGAGIAAGAAAGAGALMGIASKAADTTDRIDKLSQRLGMSREGFQEWDFVLSQAGVSIDSMQNGMKTLSQRMNDAVEGSGKGVELFEKLGVSVQDTSGKIKSQEQVFDESIAALQGMEAGIEKAALAQELFGRNGQDLLPLLNSEAGSVDELKQKAHELGLVIGDEAIDSGVKFTDTLDQVKRSFGNVVAVVGVKVMPIIQELLEWVVVHMPEIQTVVSVVFKKIEQFVSIVVSVFKEGLLPIFQTIFNWAQENWPVFQGIIEAAFNAIKTAWDNVLKPALDFLLELFKTIFDWVQEKWPIIQSVIEGVFEAIKLVWNEVLKPVLETLLSIFGSIFDWVQEKWPAIESIIKGVFDTLKLAWDEVLKPVLDVLLEIFKAILKWVQDNWPVIQSIIGGVFDALKWAFDNVLKPVLDTLIKIFGSIFDWVGKNWPTIQKVITDVFDAIKSVWDNVLKPVFDVLLDIVDEVVSFISEHFPPVQQVVEDVFDGIGQAVDKVIGFFRGLIDKIKDAISWLTSWNDTPAESKEVRITKREESLKGNYGSHGRKSKTYNKEKADGSHAHGLSYVPFDGYKAILHRGERVLTESENRNYNKQRKEGGDIYQNITINSPKPLSPSETARKLKRASRELALELT